MRKSVWVVVACAGIIASSLFYVSLQTEHSLGRVQEAQTFRIEKGENIMEVGDHLQASGIISWRGYFVYYLWKENLRHNIVAGTYRLNGGMSIPEIANIITTGDVVPAGVSIVFPEGWDSRKMAARLKANNLPGDEFLSLAQNPKPEWREKFSFLKTLPPKATLEGFLFPDTYVFPSNASAETIIETMLGNFDAKVSQSEEVNQALIDQKKTFFDIVILASIVENEVRTKNDRRMVSDIFWRRLSIGQPLQSDATLQYVLGENVLQHSFEETRVNSPYNTYVNKGLPPGPIGNPGLESLLAAVYPTSNPYYYFLNDANTKETVFSTTFEEHVANKAKHGL